MDFVEKWNFFLSAFFKEIISENMFLDLVKRKDYFKWKKLRFYIGPKNRHFSKGLVYDFVQKSWFLLSVFFTKIMSQKIFFRYLWKKRTILSEKNKSLKKEPKNGQFPKDFSKGFFQRIFPWILSKNRNFSYGCFVHKSCQKKWFLVILDRKQTS